MKAWVTTFLPFQQKWLLEPADFAIYLKGRQIGISHTTAGAIVLWAVFMGETSTVISVGEREAREVVQAALRHAKTLQDLGSKWAHCSIRGNELSFESGGRVLALPASSGGRGFSGNVFLDEFAYMEKPTEVCDAALAVSMHGYRVRISSTPNGVGNDFHRLWTNEKEHEGWSLHKTTIHDAIAQGMDVDLKKCWKIAKGDKRTFGQLFECSFLDGNEQYIPTQAVLDAVLDNTSVVSGDTFAGFDVGLKNDLSAMVILKQTADNRVWVQSVWTGKRTDWDVQQDIICQAVLEQDIIKITIDESGFGVGFVHAMKQRLGQRVEGLVFSVPSKSDLATNMCQAFLEKMIHIPNDPALIKDILSIRRVITPAGKVIYTAPHTVDGHADRAWALALAIHACGTKPGKRVAKGPGDFSNC